jgi:hypothetical protein
MSLWNLIVFADNLSTAITRTVFWYHNTIYFRSIVDILILVSELPRSLYTAWTSYSGRYLCLSNHQYCINGCILKCALWYDHVYSVEI